MAKQKKNKSNQNILYLIIGALIVMVLMKPGSIIERFYNSSISTTIIEKLDQAPPDPEDADCTINIVPTTIVAGESVVGTIKDGIATDCKVYAKSAHDFSSTWNLIYSGTTDLTGVLRETQTISIPGVYNFAAVCGDCVTNYVTVTILPADGNDGDNDGALPECSFICNNVGYDTGTEATGPDCVFGNYYVDNSGVDCCCWYDTSTPVCQSAWPIPESQDDCYARPGCDSNKECIFVDGGLQGQNSCECREIQTCEDYCQWEGFVSGWCTTSALRDPCGNNAVRAFAADPYCTSAMFFDACCCSII